MVGMLKDAAQLSGTEQTSTSSRLSEDTEFEAASYYVGIDPGEATGVAVVNSEGELIDSITLPKWSGLNGIIGLKAHNKPIAGVVMESFQLYPGKALSQSFSQFKTVEVIGVCKYLCELHGIPVIMQGAHQKAFFSDGKLERLGYTVASVHERDALRHVLYYLQFIKKEINLVASLVD